MTATELARRPETIESALIPAALPEGMRWLALVDGVDEIVEPGARRAFVLSLARFAERQQGAAQLLVTTRPLPASESSALQTAGLTPYALEPFDRPRLIDFATRWFGDAEVAADYLRQVDRACLGPLVRVPLLATITAVVHEAYPDSPLPGNQYLLYEQYRRHLARSKAPQLREQWQWLEDAVDGNPQGAPAIRELAAQRGEALLHYLAVTQTGRGVESLTRTALSWLDDRLDTPASRLVLGWPEHVRGILAGTGMLLRTATDVRFLHNSFAEHLAAEYRARQLPSSGFFDEPAWHTVISQARGHDKAALATLIHAAHRSTNLAKELLERLEEGTPADRLVAAHLLAEGPLLDDTHAQWFLTQLDATDPDLEPDWWSLAARIRHPKIANTLTQLASRPNERRYAAAAALAAHRPDTAGHELTRIVQSATEPWETRCDALRALIRLGDGRAQRAALALREQLLEEDRDLLDLENTLTVLKEVWPTDELETYLQERSLFPDETARFTALASLAIFSSEHAEDALDHLFALIDPNCIDSPTSLRSISTLAQLPGGKAKLNGVFAAARCGLKQQLQLARRQIQRGLLEQEVVVVMLAGTAELPRWYEFTDDLELFDAAQALRLLLNDLHEDVRSALHLVLQRNVVFCPDGSSPRNSVLLALMVAGWELMSLYGWGGAWGPANSVSAVKKVLVDGVLSPSEGSPGAIWLHCAEDFSDSPIGTGNDLEAVIPLDSYLDWGTWLGWLAMVVDESGPWDSLVSELISFTVDTAIPRSGRTAILLMVALLLCVRHVRMDRERRAAYLYFLADTNRHRVIRLDRILREIARMIVQEPEAPQA
ncbi:NACHT domain-containing protein [Streptomyces sp. NPDC090798]|uniref:NACHT domain-containing protein n=1 Tax=Streptomyces sp. NPDC090798 TaxID=3365968 RepID=UPI00382146CA